MGNEVRDLLGSGFIRYAISVLVSIISAHNTFGGSSSTPPSLGANGYLKVTVDAPDNVKSLIQWTTRGSPNDWYSGSRWFNNGDTATQSAGQYYLIFRPLAGWALPATTQISITPYSTNAAYHTNTVTGSCSFAGALGEYQGLFSEPSGPKFESSGFLEAFGRKGLSFTGKILSAGHRYSFSGSFDQTGNAWATIPRAGASPLSVHLIAGDDTLTGEITGETWTATLLARRNAFYSNPAEKVGKYTFAFASGANTSAQPGGDSFGTMTVDSSARVTLAVTMSDGTKAAQKTFLSKDLQWPLYTSLYSGKGFAMGWLQLQGESDLNPPAVELYRECNYTGSSYRLTRGDYWTWNALFYAGTNAAGSIIYDTTSGRSMKIPYGFAVTLYTNTYFGGTPFSITTNDPCFLDDGIDVFHSMRIETNGAPPLPDFGTITWMKPAAPGAKRYPAGFTNQMQSFVSKYQPATQAPALDYNVGSLVFENGNPSESITNEFSIDSSGRISGPNNLNLTIAGSGSFKGSVKNPLTGKVISVSGVILQRQQFARGFFIDGEQSGSVYFGP